MRTVWHEEFKGRVEQSFSTHKTPVANRPPKINERSEGASYVKFIDCAGFAA
jgi:hypothetical protein